MYGYIHLTCRFSPNIDSDRGGFVFGYHGDIEWRGDEVVEREEERMSEGGRGVR